MNLQRKTLQRKKSKNTACRILPVTLRLLDDYIEYVYNFDTKVIFGR